MSRRFYEETSGVPTETTLSNRALNVIQARAHDDGPERRVHVRVAGLNGRIWILISPTRTGAPLRLTRTVWRLEEIRR